MTIKPDLDAIRARCDAASPGQWIYVKGEYEDGSWNGDAYVVSRKDDMSHQVSGCYCGYGYGDIEFIAHSRTDIPALLDYIKDLHQQIHTLEKSLDSNFKGELVAKARLQAVNFSIDNNGCVGELTNDDWCKFCFMRPYCEERKWLKNTFTNCLSQTVNMYLVTLVNCMIISEKTMDGDNND